MTPMLFVTRIEKEKGCMAGPLTRLEEPLKGLSYEIDFENVDEN